MAWISIIDMNEAQGELKRLYDAVKTPQGHVDNILKIHSLRPRTLKAHLTLYKAVLHSHLNELSPRERELVGICVSLLNKCDYCVKHHTAGLTRIVGDPMLAGKLASASIQPNNNDILTDREREICKYSIKLTKFPQNMTEEDLQDLRDLGLSDKSILDLNQVVAYFAYANRTVQGLGVEIGGELLGLHPSDDEPGFRHE